MGEPRTRKRKRTEGGRKEEAGKKEGQRQEEQEGDSRGQESHACLSYNAEKKELSQFDESLEKRKSGEN